MRVAFRAGAGTKRADFSMMRELTDEVGPNPVGFDVVIVIDVEATASSP